MPLQQARKINILNKTALSIAGGAFLSTIVFTSAAQLSFPAHPYPNVDAAAKLWKKQVADSAAKTTSSPKDALKPVGQSTTPLPSTTPVPQNIQNPVSQNNTRVFIPSASLNTTVRAATVNILCTSATAGTLAPISGSGVIIDPRGIILTNAHVAQFFLLKNYYQPNFITCTIRTGSPATAAYKATLIYLPPAWIDENARQINAESPLGTGENDYALLAITESVDPTNPLPASFPFIAPSTSFVPTEADYPVLIAGYPADLVGSINTVKNLYAASADAVIKQGYYYHDANNTDLFALGGTILAQGGSSGGPVVDHYDGSLLGIISISSVGTTTASKELDAISLSHVSRSLMSSTGKTLSTFLEGPISNKIVEFMTTIFPGEYKKLVEAINQD